MSSQYHSHIAKGSMKDAHNLDDRQDRARICVRETQPVQISSKSSNILSKLDAMKAALAARDAEQAKQITQ